jgi:Domain of unknown function (DUF6438)
MANRCDDADKCELTCLRQACGSLPQCRRSCRRAARLEPKVEREDELGFRAATAAFERRAETYCSPRQRAARGEALPGPAAQFDELARKGPALRDHPESCRIHPARTDISEIAIERTGCYGTCPIYWLRLRADGSAETDARAYTPHLGHHRGSLDPRRFQELANLVLELGFFGFDDSYSCLVTDSPTVYVSITRGKQRKIISHYAPDMTGPRALEIIEEKIDDYADEVHWSD